MKKFTLEKGRWYAWNMYPGYGGVPYASPIFIFDIEPLKTGQRRLRLNFLNAAYAQGVQGFELTLKVIHHAPHHLVCDLGTEDMRTAVICGITRSWLDAHFRGFMENYSVHSGQTLEAYLDEHLRGVKSRER